MLTTQAAAIRRLEASSIFYVSQEFRGRHYLVHKTPKPFNIHTADTFCSSFGEYLVELDNDDEFDFVFEFVRSIGGDTDFATGVNDIDKEGYYVYYHSKKPATFLRWGNSEPK